jgi:hypothetical protein
VVAVALAFNLVNAIDKIPVGEPPTHLVTFCPAPLLCTKARQGASRALLPETRGSGRFGAALHDGRLLAGNGGTAPQPCRPGIPLAQPHSVICSSKQHR